MVKRALSQYSWQLRAVTTPGQSNAVSPQYISHKQNLAALGFLTALLQHGGSVLLGRSSKKELIKHMDWILKLPMRSALKKLTVLSSLIIRAPCCHYHRKTKPEIKYTGSTDVTWEPAEKMVLIHHTDSNFQLPSYWLAAEGLTSITAITVRSHPHLCASGRRDVQHAALCSTV